MADKIDSDPSVIRDIEESAEKIEELIERGEISPEDLGPILTVIDLSQTALGNQNKDVQLCWRPPFEALLQRGGWS